MYNKEYKNNLPPGVKQHIRAEKGRIRKEFPNQTDRKEQIEKLYEQFAYFQRGSQKAEEKK